MVLQPQFELGRHTSYPDWWLGHRILISVARSAQGSSAHVLL